MTLLREEDLDLGDRQTSLEEELKKRENGDSNNGRKNGRKRIESDEK